MLSTVRLLNDTVAAASCRAKSPFRLHLLLSVSALTLVTSAGHAWAGSTDLSAAAWTVDGSAAGGTNAAAGDNLTNTTNANVTSVTISGTGYVANAAGAGIDAGTGNIGEITITGSGNSNVAVSGSSGAINIGSATTSTTINNTGSPATTITGAGVNTQTLRFYSNTNGVSLTLNQGNTAGTTSGTISNTDTGNSYAVYARTNGGSQTINNYNGSITGASNNTGYAALSMIEAGDGNLAVTNGSASGSGTISSTNAGKAIHFATSGTGTITLTNTQGTITSAATSANLGTVRIAQSATGGVTTISNSATIENTNAAGGGNAIYLSSAASSGGFSITNNSGGSITAATTGVGAIRIGTAHGVSTITNSGTITGAGTTGAGGTAIAIDNSANTTKVTFNLESGSTTNGALKLGTGGVSDDIVNLKGGTLNGDIISAGAGKGTLNVTASTSSNGDFGTTNALAAVNVNGGTLTLNNAIKATTTIISASTNLTVGTTGKTITSALTNSGTLDVGDKTLTVAGNITGTGTLGVSLSSTASGYIVNTTNTAGYTPGGTVTITPILTTTVSNGSKYALIWGKAGNAPTLGTISASGGGLVSWTVSDGTAYATTADVNGHTIIAEDVVMVASVNSASSVAGVTTNSATVVDIVTSYSGGNTQLKTIGAALQGLSSAAEVDNAGAQLRTDVNRGAIEGATRAVVGALSTISTRSDQIRLASNAGTGINTGDVIRGLGVWGQAFGHYGDQDRRQGIDGYNAKMGGLALGADTQVMDPVRAGLAFSYAKTRVDSKGANDGNSLNIDSYQGTLYGSYVGSPYYIDGSVALSLHNYDSTRQIAFTGFSDTATGDYEGYQVTVKVDGGYPIELGSVVVTPMAGMSYSTLEQLAYSESSSNGSALQVEGQTSSSIKSSLGGRISKTFEFDGTTYTPEANLAWEHEFRTDPSRSTASYIAGGSSFTSASATPAKNGLVLGFGLAVASIDNLTIRAKYDAEIRDQYLGHNGVVEARFDF